MRRLNFRVKRKVPCYRLRMPTFELEEKVCACGCGSTWKALKGSPNKYKDRSHEKGIEGLPDFNAVKGVKPRRGRPAHHFRPRRSRDQ